MPNEVGFATLMISPAKKTHTWQQSLADLITDPKELLTLLELDPALLDAARAAAALFPLKVTHSFVARMQKKNLHDPLLLQILPLGAELTVTPGYSSDPLKEAEANPIPGLLQKYHGRVLVTLTSACAVNCRFCFRRDFPYAENNPGRFGWEKIFSYIRQKPSIAEVILSGGDPLAVSDHLLKQFTDQLSRIPHVKRLRIHTRLPIVLPERVTEDFIQWIKQLTMDVVIVIHCNHAQEINHEVKNALWALRQAGVVLLNQTVLLKGVNDNIDAIIALNESLLNAGVIPYYLHVLDKVQGAAHFDLPLQKARELHAEMNRLLSGYLVPRLVCEQPGQVSKTPVF